LPPILFLNSDAGLEFNLNFYVENVRKEVVKGLEEGRLLIVIF